MSALRQQLGRVMTRVTGSAIFLGRVTDDSHLSDSGVSVPTKRVEIRNVVKNYRIVGIRTALFLYVMFLWFLTF